MSALSVSALATLAAAAALGVWQDALPGWLEAGPGGSPHGATQAGLPGPVGAARMPRGPLVPRRLARTEAVAGERSLARFDALVADRNVDLATLFGLEVSTIVIDPGHGGRDPGATGPTGLTEKAVNLAIARRLQERLNERGDIRAVLTRDSDEFLSLRERVEIANARDADLFLSLHVNYLPQEPPTVIETYYFGPGSDEAALRAARRENRTSEYHMGEFREVLAKIGRTFKHQESRALAQSIHGQLYRSMKAHNEDLLDSGTKTAPFVVLLGAEMPSVLAEVTCLSNEREERRLRTASYRERIAGYLEKGIKAYLDRNRPDTQLVKGA